MKIEQIDTHFRATELDQAEEKACYQIPCAGFDLYGVFYDEENGRFTRMDAAVADQVSDKVARLSTYTSGGRIRFSTDSSVIGISVEYPALVDMVHMPLTGSGGFALLEKTGDTYKTVTVFRPNHSEKTGYTGEVRVKKAGRHEYILFFPLYNGVSKLQIFLDKTATLYEPEKYRQIKPILYYGASIDQGGCASRPDSSYTALISKWNEIDFINLGFSGNAKGEPIVAHYCAAIDCSLFLYAYDGTAPSIEYLEQTHFPFYELYRKTQKDVPIVIMSVPCFENYRNTQQSREVLKRSYEKAKELGDEHVYFLDGETLFGDKDRENCTVEGIHPNDLGFYRIAEKIYELYRQIDPELCLR